MTNYAIFLCSWDVDDSLALPRLSTQWEWWAGWSGEILGVTTTLGFSRGLNMGWPGEFLFLLQQVHLSPGFPWHWSPTQASSTLPLGWVSSSWEMGWILPTWLPCIRWMGRSRGTFSRMTSPTTFPGWFMLMVTVILMTKQCNIDAGKHLHWKVQKVGKWNFSKCDDSRQHNEAITNPCCKWWHCNVITTATMCVITLQCSASPLHWEQPWVSSSHQPPGIFARFLFCKKKIAVSINISIHFICHT